MHDLTQISDTCTSDSKNYCEDLEGREGSAVQSHDHAYRAGVPSDLHLQQLLPPTQERHALRGGISLHTNRRLSVILSVPANLTVRLEAVGLEATVL